MFLCRISKNITIICEYASIKRQTYITPLPRTTSESVWQDRVGIRSLVMMTKAQTLTKRLDIRYTGLYNYGQVYAK